MGSRRWRRASWRPASTRSAPSWLWGSETPGPRCAWRLVGLPGMACSGRPTIAKPSLAMLHCDLPWMGLAHAQVIAENIRNGGDLNAMVPGSKVGVPACLLTAHACSTVPCYRRTSAMPASDAGAPLGHFRQLLSLPLFTQLCQRAPA